MKRFYNLSLLLFITFFALSLNLPLNLLKSLGGLFQRLFIFLETPFYKFLELKEGFSFASDSPEMLFHVLFLVLLSIFFTFILKKWTNTKNEEIKTLLFQSSSYLLAFFLLKYGFDKLVMNQFHYPEPNILHTEFGNLDKDILYWSLMGKSYSYNLFLGISEFAAGILLLIPKLRKLGSILSFGILINVFVVNFSFGIEVKIVCLYLILLNFVVIFAYRASFIHFLFGRENLKEFDVNPLKIKRKSTIKFLLIFFLLFEISFNAFSNQTWNYQKKEKSILCGSYQITDNLATENLIFNSKTKRFFVNSRNYLITEDEDGNFKSFQALISDKVILLKKYPDFVLKFNLKYKLISIESKNKIEKVIITKLAF